MNENGYGDGEGYGNGRGKGFGSGSGAGDGDGSGDGENIGAGVTDASAAHPSGDGIGRVAGCVFTANPSPDDLRAIVIYASILRKEIQQ